MFDLFVHKTNFLILSLNKCSSFSSLSLWKLEKYIWIIEIILKWKYDSFIIQLVVISSWCQDLINLLLTNKLYVKKKKKIIILIYIILVMYATP